MKRPRTVDQPTVEQIENYYFDIFEVCQMLGVQDEAVTRELRKGKVAAVKHKKKWYVRPDQISVLRGLIPHCRQINLPEPQDLKVRTWYSRLWSWCTSAYRHILSYVITVWNSIARRPT